MSMHKIRYTPPRQIKRAHYKEEKEANCISNLACLRKSFKAKKTFRVVKNIKKLTTKLKLLPVALASGLTETI